MKQATFTAFLLLAVSFQPCLANANTVEVRDVAPPIGGVWTRHHKRFLDPSSKRGRSVRNLPPSTRLMGSASSAPSLQGAKKLEPFPAHPDFEGKETWPNGKQAITGPALAPKIGGGAKVAAPAIMVTPPVPEVVVTPPKHAHVKAAEIPRPAVEGK